MKMGVNKKNKNNNEDGDDLIAYRWMKFDDESEF
jgi:hypothetical protein